MKKNLKLIIIVFVAVIFSSLSSYSQCFNIESILVDACDNGPDEGQNEMVRFKVGNAPLNLNQMGVDWPSNSWEGLVQNTTTARKVIDINREIQAAGGCGQVLEPTNNTLPANATVILVTSYLFSVELNPFGAVNETIYIIFQDSDSTMGHFGNFGTSAMRTLTISFGNSCSDTVSYNRSLLVDANGQHAAGNGALVEFAPNGNATYLNNGCSAPVETSVFEFTSTITPTCVGNTILLESEIIGYENIQWTSAHGTFTNPNNSNTSFTITNSDFNSVSITLSATNACGEVNSQIIQIPLLDQVLPVFDNFPTSICFNDELPILPTTSSNGVIGIWSPAIVDKNYKGNYVFTPNSGQCANQITKKIDIFSFDFDLFDACDGNDMKVKAIGDSNEIQYVWKNKFGEIIATNSDNFDVSDYLKKSFHSLPFKLIVEASVGDCVLIKEIEISSINCTIQKGVSPNDDFKNDFFDLRTQSVLNLTIYNRYGTEVYQKALYKDEWYGQNKNGNLLPTGTYFYAILTAENKTITGWVQLVY